MDRLIALLAAFVGLIALGGALLVHNNAEAVQMRQAAEIASLRQALGQAPAAPPAEAPVAAAAAQPADDGTADALLALQNRIVLLEQLTASQTAELEKARTAIADISANGVPSAGVTDFGAQPVQSATASAITADGPTNDCIPLGTRFMAQSGDSFPICKTKAVVSVAGVNEGEAFIEGPGSVVIGSTAQLEIPGCTIAVLSADISGFAEMRVTCL